MSYDSVESSVDGGAPVELYQFNRESGSFYMTSFHDDYVYSSKTYIATPIKRDRIKQTQNSLKDGLRLSFPLGVAFSDGFVAGTPDLLTTVTILRGHYGDGEFVTYWKGRIVGSAVSGNEVTLECESVFTSIKRPGLRAKFQYTCRHALYSAFGCRVNSGAYRHSGIVQPGSTASVVIVDGADSFADGYFNGGFVTDNFGASRAIVSHVGNSLTLTRAYGAIPTGVVSVYPGCDHTKEQCLAKFNNLDNFGGFPYIPTRNPFDGSSII